MAFEASSNTAPNAKQIVFLFMAATVVAVVVFLCGVLVGRGVPVAGGLTAPDGSVGSMAVDLPPVTLSSPSSEPSAAASESSELTYYRRLDGGAAQPEVLNPESTPVSDDAGPSVGTAGSDASRDVPKPPVTDVAPEPVADTSDRPESAARLERPETDDEPLASAPAAPDVQPVTPPTGGFSLQVMALRSEDAAQKAVAQLVEKGYPARLLRPEPGAPVLFRVRVGPFADRAEAQRIQRRLETEEQFQPFLTR